MPAYGRQSLTGVCLRQLRRTCDTLAENGLEASAVVVADDENLHVAHELGFGTVRRDNRFLARKFNDGIQLACDPNINPRPADYVIPFGSDDWIDHQILRWLPPPNTVLAFKWASFVSEDGRELAETRLNYPGGVGIRVYPRQLLEPCGYRPADEDRNHGCDTSILHRTRQTLRRKQRKDLRIVYGDRHPRQIVDWKTAGHQMNTFADVTGLYRSRTIGDPFELLTGIYPADALEEMADHYQHARVAV